MGKIQGDVPDSLREYLIEPEQVRREVAETFSQKGGREIKVADLDLTMYVYDPSPIPETDYVPSFAFKLIDNKGNPKTPSWLDVYDLLGHIDVDETIVENIAQAAHMETKVIGLRTLEIVLTPTQKAASRFNTVVLGVRIVDGGFFVDLLEGLTVEKDGGLIVVNPDYAINHLAHIKQALLNVADKLPK